MQRLCSVRELEEYRNLILTREEKGKTKVSVCMTGCRAYGAADVFAALQEEVGKQGLSAQVEIRPTGCHGLCAKAPVLAIDPLGIQYQEVAPQDAADIVSLTIKEGPQGTDRYEPRPGHRGGDGQQAERKRGGRFFNRDEVAVCTAGGWPAQIHHLQRG